MSTWPFDQPQNCIAVTQKQCVDKTLPILQVVHDSEDHGWHFLTGLPFAMSDAMLVTLSSIVQVDPSLFTVAGLPPGWQAIRESAKGAWIRGQTPPEADL